MTLESFPSERHLRTWIAWGAIIVLVGVSAYLGWQRELSRIKYQTAERALLRHVVDPYSKCFIATHDTDGQLVMVHPTRGLLQLLGRRWDETYLQPVSELMSDNTRRRHDAALIESGPNVAICVDRFGSLVTMDGEEIRVRANVGEFVLGGRTYYTVLIDPLGGD